MKRFDLLKQLQQTASDGKLSDSAKVAVKAIADYYEQTGRVTDAQLETLEQIQEGGA